MKRYTRYKSEIEFLKSHDVLVKTKRFCMTSDAIEVKSHIDAHLPEQSSWRTTLDPPANSQQWLLWELFNPGGQYFHTSRMQPAILNSYLIFYFFLNHVESFPISWLDSILCQMLSYVGWRTGGQHCSWTPPTVTLFEAVIQSYSLPCSSALTADPCWSSLTLVHLKRSHLKIT